MYIKHVQFCLYIIVPSSDVFLPVCIKKYTGDLIPGSAGHTLLSSLSNNFFDV